MKKNQEKKTKEEKKTNTDKKNRKYSTIWKYSSTFKLSCKHGTIFLKLINYLNLEIFVYRNTN